MVCELRKPSQPRKYAQGGSALMYAAAGGHAGCVRRLLAAGADVRRTHLHGGTALMEAATAGSVACLEALAAAGAAADHVDGDGVTALMAAALGKYW